MACLRVGRDPEVHIVLARQDDGHIFRIHQADLQVGVGGQETEQIVRRLAVSQFPHRRPLAHLGRGLLTR